MKKTKSSIAACSDKKLKVAFLCHSDNLGGASVVTRRLVHALREEGIDARMMVFKKLSDDESVEQAPAGRFRRGYHFMIERAGIAKANGFSRSNLFKVSTASSGIDPVSEDMIRDADVVVLSWINQGLMSLEGIRRLGLSGKPLVWIMHDMWNLTGICHHAYECEGYTGSCGSCMFLGGKNEDDLSRKVWLRKHALYDAVPMTFVAVSNWLAECCRKSSLLGGRDVRVIPNAFPVDSFVTAPTMTLGRVPADKKVILMGAARLDDPIKGLGLAIDALNYLFDNDPHTTRDSIAVFFGSVRDQSVFDDLRFPHLHIGMINDPRYLREIYARSSVVLSTSLYETLPGTLVEGQAAGCLPVTFGKGGQSDIVDHKVNGYIAAYKDTRDIARGIRWALSETPDRDGLHEQVRRRFSSKSVAARYIELFRELLEKQGTPEA